MNKLITVLMLLLGSFSVLAEVTISDGWVRAMPPGSYMTAAYLSLENNAEESLKLISITSSAAKDCSIHETVIEDGMSRMHQLNAIELPPSTKISLQPGGMHIMLMELNKPLIKGESFPLQLEFSDGSVKKIELKIGKDG